MVPGLVAVGVLADEAGDVRGGVFALHVVRRLEEAVQLRKHRLAGTEQVLEALHVLRDEPDVLPAGALGVVGGLVAGVDRVERLGEGAVDLAAAHELQVRIPEMAVGVAAVAIDDGRGLVAEELGGVRQGAVRDGVFHVVGDGLGVEVGRDVAVFHPQVLTAVGPGGGVGHRGDHLLLGEAGLEALDDVVGEGDEARVAHHAVRLVAHQVPHRQVALLLEDVVEGGGDVVAAVRVDEGHQRHLGAVGVPEGEGGVVPEVALPDDIVGAAVLAVHVVEDGRSDHRVVHRGIEDGLGVGIRAGDGDAAQFLVPGRPRGGLRGLEVPAGEFRGHVGLGAFDGNGGEGDLHEHLRPFLDLAQVVVAVDGLAGASALAVVVRVLRDGEFHGRLGEFGPEEDLLVLGPSRREAVSAEGLHVAGVVLDDLEAGVGDVIPAAAVLQVEDEVRVVRGREGIAVEAHTGGGGHFRRDAVALQGNAVIAGFADFLRAVRIGPGAGLRVFLRSAGGRGGAGRRHHRDVEQVADACAAEVRMAEADDGPVAVVVAGAPVPALRDAGRAQLHEAEGHVGAHEHVPVATRPDLRVHEGGIVFRGRGFRVAGGQQKGRCGKKNSAEFHFNVVYLVNIRIICHFSIHRRLNR